MSDQEQAQRMIYESVKSRLTMNFEQFAKVLNEWEITPLKHKQQVIGGVMRKDNELHIGYGEKPKATIRKHLKETIGRVLQQYGYAVTVVNAANVRGLKFCERLGFVVTRKENDNLYLQCDRCNYV
jgi:hypothetical protein